MRNLLAILLLLASIVGCDVESADPSPSSDPTYTEEDVRAYQALLEKEGKLSRQRFEALDAARPSARRLSEFIRLFPAAQVRVTYFDPSRMPGINAQVELHGRYEFTMQLPAIFDATGTTVTGFGDPAFYLLEIESRNGRETRYVSTGQRVFGVAEWERIVTSNGDFSTIGYPMRTDAPIKNLSTP